MWLLVAFRFSVALVAALLAAALMEIFTPRQSPLAFAMWTAFFLVVQTPLILDRYFARCVQWVRARIH